MLRAMTLRGTVMAWAIGAAAALAEPLLLHDFDGAASLAAALRPSDLEVAEEAAGLGLLVKGPTAPDQPQQPLCAEIRRRIEGIDLTAGMQADRKVVEQGPAQWVGGIGFTSEHDAGREALEVRTSLGQNDHWGIVGLEIGPRFERRLPGGIVVFLDGKAEARSTRLAAPPPATGTQTLPGQATDGFGLIGLTGRTGLMR